MLMSYESLNSKFDLANYLFLTLESWLTPRFKGIFMAFPTK